ncbi:hypothetical protein QJS10_CPA05g02398 [Acorus calamus]|uniref:Uncharacterized protein n=1 Tax=Acorus calamus TaxID=4465 RepID=A0AAV9EUD1_ACOCL|nr:hypothetical protein QJS10_CPA05g02398 [Acorus calamus]
MDVTELRIDSMSRWYLRARLSGNNGTNNKMSEWFQKLVKCGTFNRPIVDQEGLMLSVYKM